MITGERLVAAHRATTAYLLAQRGPEGFWEGRLSSSALSTATALSALSQAGAEQDAPLLRGAVEWLAETQRVDGGWGDTPDSPSNLSTTLLALSALRLAATSPWAVSVPGGVLEAADNYVTRQAGHSAQQRIAALGRLYGADRTFAVPILMNCALAGLVPWREIPELPFELALFPQPAYRALRLHVVSYALPALIAIGILLARRAPARCPVLRAVRRLAEPGALKRLLALQPEHGGFLEATPLTSFVAMSLLPIFGPDNPVAERCLRFLRASVRDDGSWPIDTNLSVWLTTGAVSALLAGGERLGSKLEATRTWLRERQFRVRHPYTGADPGGWSWTHLPGGVPDADDTAGALVALAALERVLPNGNPSPRDLNGGESVHAGVQWLLNLQNRDGGWPTFCQGWGRLPFDRSAPDITAHVLRALTPWKSDQRVRHAMARGLEYLAREQRGDGSWVPLWFGNQHTAGHHNPVFGTARVLAALAQSGECHLQVERGIQYLVAAQAEDGGWGGERGCPASVEETALATNALALFPRSAQARGAMECGAARLVAWVEEGTWTRPAPIGLYFASLWYSERLYPVIWTVEALGRVLAQRAREGEGHS